MRASFLSNRSVALPRLPVRRARAGVPAGVCAAARAGVPAGVCAAARARARAGARARARCCRLRVRARVRAGALLRVRSGLRGRGETPPPAVLEQGPGRPGPRDLRAGLRGRLRGRLGHRQDALAAARVQAVPSPATGPAPRTAWAAPPSPPSRTPPPTGGSCPGRTARAGSPRTPGPAGRPATPYGRPAPPTPIVCAAASCRLTPGGPASAAAGRPARSCPGRGRCRRPPRRRPCAAGVPPWTDAGPTGRRHPVRHVVRADHDHADVRRRRAGSASSSATWRSRSSDWAPGSATLRSSTGRSATAASPEASSAPGRLAGPAHPLPGGRGVAQQAEPQRAAHRGRRTPSRTARPRAAACGAVPPPTGRFASRTSASSRPDRRRARSGRSRRRRTPRRPRSAVPPSPST